MQRKLVLTAIAFLSYSCSVLIGNVDPSSSKTRRFQIKPANEIANHWKQISVTTSDTSETDEAPNLAFQTIDKTSVMSINTYCRSILQSDPQDLHTYTNQLILGLDESQARRERFFEIDRSPALETTLEGNYEGIYSRLKVVVVKNQSCLFDLIFTSNPEQFSKYVNDFDRFVASLKFN